MDFTSRSFPELKFTSTVIIITVFKISRNGKSNLISVTLTSEIFIKKIILTEHYNNANFCPMFLLPWLKAYVHIKKKSATSFPVQIYWLFSYDKNSSFKLTLGEQFVLAGFWTTYLLLEIHQFIDSLEHIGYHYNACFDTFIDYFSKTKQQ